jgi:hypothetical protein
MALNDNGYFLVSRTVLYTAPVDTVAPATGSLDSPGAAWTILGHIGDETAQGNVAFTRDGGDVTTKGSITKKAIRQVVQPTATGFDVDVSQFTREVMALYVGTSGGTTFGVFQVEGASDGVATETAALVVWEDGTKRVALYAPRVSWTGRDNITTDSIEDAIVVPLHAAFLDSNTVLGPTGKPLRYDWISPTLMPLS